MKGPSRSTTRGPVVLLVQPSRDDSLEMYTELLRYHGLAVIPVSDARDALMLAPQADIVVTGIHLDDPMDGVELVLRLRHGDCTRSTPIVVLTACAWPKERERAEGAGCDVFLPKPCLPNDLLRKVQQLLTATRSQTADTRHVFHHPLHTGRGVSMNRDELEGKAGALKGKIKQAAGTLTRDPDLHDEGVIDEVAGKTQSAVGRTKRKLGEAIEHIGNVIKK